MSGNLRKSSILPKYRTIIEDDKKVANDEDSDASRTWTPCKVCGRVFVQLSELEEHERRHNGTLAFLCDVCPKAFRFRESLLAHSAQHTGIRPFRCDSCFLAFASPSGLLVHQRQCHKQPSVVVEPTDSTVVSVSGDDNDEGMLVEYLEELNEIEENAEDVAENNAEDIAVDPEVLSAYESEHNQDDGDDDAALVDSVDDASHPISLVIVSNEAPQATTSVEIEVEVIDDFNTTAKKQPFSADSGPIVVEISHGCVECSDIFPTRRSLLLHCKRMHKPKNKRKYVRKTEQTEKHNNTPADPNEPRAKRKYVRKTPRIAIPNSNDVPPPPPPPPSTECTLPARPAQYSAILPTTKRTGHYQFPCDQCPRRFTSANMLQQHKRSECGRQPPHECQECGKFFHSRGALKGHATVHTGVLPHECSHCGKAFRMRGQLTVHERKHTGERPYECDQCPKTFSYRESLLVHRSVHDESHLRYSCEACGGRFSCVRNLRWHMDKRPDTCAVGKRPTEEEVKKGAKKRTEGNVEAEVD